MAVANMKQCSRCEKNQVLDRFHKDRTKKDGLCTVCRTCKTTTATLFYLSNKVRILDIAKDRYQDPTQKRDAKYRSWKSTIKKNFSLSVDDYNIIFASQNGCCKICNKHQTEFARRLGVDHCHTSGKVRGLLCDNCNRGIGFLGDSDEILLSAMNYLRGHK